MFCDVLTGDLRKVYLNEEKITITELDNLLLVMWKINQYGQTVIVHSLTYLPSLFHVLQDV